MVHMVGHGLAAQADVLAIIMIVGIVTALTGAAYMWGAPLIDKRSAFTDYKIAEGFILYLDKKITEIAGSGGGEANIDIPTGYVRVVPHDDENDANNNSIILEFVSKQPLAIGGDSYARTTVLGDTAPYGSEPRVISVKGAGTGNGYIITIKLRYRELLSPNGAKSVIALSTDSTQGKSKSAQANYIKANQSADGLTQYTWINVNVQ